MLGLALASLAALGGAIWSIHDGLSLAFLIAAAGLIWSGGGRRSWALGIAIALAGLWWSSLDGSYRSAWWRGKILLAKLSGNLEPIQWEVIWRRVLGDWHNASVPSPDYFGRFALLREDVVNGRKLELYQTDHGKFWIPAPGAFLLASSQWEITVQRAYEMDETRVQSGDTVIDCGAHIGLFTRYSLDRGAARVVAIEPDAANIASLEANFAGEIATGRVKLISGGVWDQKGSLALAHIGNNSEGHTFVLTSPELSKTEGIPVYQLDQIVNDLKLDRVDFIKMDIEGAERRALRGAMRTLRRYRPKLAISVYHLADDPVAIRTIVYEAQPCYRVQCKSLVTGTHYIGPKILFFRSE